MTSSIVLVNPYKSAAWSYSNIIKNFTPYELVGLWTSSELMQKWEVATPYENIETHLYAEGSVFQVKAALNQYTPIAFIPCDDAAVQLADQLQCLHDRSRANVLEMRQVRSSKIYYMSYLYAQGLIETKQSLVTPNNRGYVLAPFDKPRVLKPVDGAGNEDVYIVRNEMEALEIVNKNSHKGFMIQDFIDGDDEYCVEIIACGDKLKCTSIMKYGRKYLVDDKKPWRYDNDLVDPETDPNAPKLIAYAKCIVKALGVRIGPTWTQIIIDKNGKPHLVEINFRAQGHGHFSAIVQSANCNYAAETIKAHLVPDKVNEDTYKKLGEFKKLSINNHTERQIDFINFDPIRKLKSVIAVWPNEFVVPGYAKKTTGFMNNLAMVIVTNQDSMQFARDVEAIDKWQETVEH